MLEFYKNAFVKLVSLLVFSALFAYLCIDHTFPHLVLLPNDKSEIFWKIQSTTDFDQGGKSIAKIHDENYSLDFELSVSNEIRYPFASVELIFQNKDGIPEVKDLSAFNSLSFMIKCSTVNELTFITSILDEKISDEQGSLTYRQPAAFFSCDENWKLVELDLTRLDLPVWWFEAFNVKLSKNDYQLDKVARFQFGSTYQSPIDTLSRVQISTLTLKGDDWYYIYLLIISLVVVWGIYIFWFFKRYASALTGELKNKILREKPLIAYQQLSMKPQRDKDNKAIIQLMATDYADPLLNLDFAVAKTGVSRTKINDILKAELGFTFTGYLNKLRLTEAARLLSAEGEANVAEIAYSVGYKNVSYFNKLFKEEYGCTPKAFKTYL